MEIPLNIQKTMPLQTLSLFQIPAIFLKTLYSILSGILLASPGFGKEQVMWCIPRHCFVLR